MRNRITGALAIAALGIGLAAPAAATDWASNVVHLIASHNSYPRSAQLRGEEGTAKIRISVGADGSIEKVELLQATGSEILDREAVRIPARVGNVPPPPDGPAAIIVPITWKLS